MPYLFHSIPNDPPIAIDPADSLPAEVGGLPAFYYWRSSIADGTYQHPTKGWELTVTPITRSAWESTFRQMRAAGIEIPILADHKAAAAATLGYVIDIRQQGPWLQELHQYLGTEARDIALRNRVSVAVSPDFVDSAGNHFGQAIIHSAIVPHPLVPHQPQAIAASSIDLQPTLNASALIHSIDLIQLASPAPGDHRPLAAVDRESFAPVDLAPLASVDRTSLASLARAPLTSVDLAPLAPVDHAPFASHDHDHLPSPVHASLASLASLTRAPLASPARAAFALNDHVTPVISAALTIAKDAPHPADSDSRIDSSSAQPAGHAGSHPAIPLADPIALSGSNDPAPDISLSATDPNPPRSRPLNPHAELDRLLLTGHITPASRDRFCTILSAIDTASTDLHLSLQGQSHSLAHAILLALQANAPFNFATQTPIQVLPRILPDSADLDDTAAIDFGRARAARLQH